MSLKMRGNSLSIKRYRGSPFFMAFCCIYLIVITFYAPVFILSYETKADNVLFLLISFLPKLFFLIYMWSDILRNQIFYRQYSSIFLIALVLFISLCMSYFANSSGLEYLISLLFICTAFIYFNIYRLSYKEIKKLMIIVTVLTASILCNTMISKDFTIYGNIPGKINPNTGAFVLAMMFMIFWSYFLCYKKILTLIISILCLILQFIYMSRIALFGILIFVLLTVISKARSKSFKSKTVFTVILLCAVLGVILPYVYTNILFKHFGYGKLIIYGKDIFSGREIIWSLTFDSIKNHLWFGVGNRLNFDRYLSDGGNNALIMNAHNQQIGILAAFGLIPFITFYLCFAYIVSLPYQQKNVNRFPVICVITIVLMSYTDITFFSDYNYLYIIVVYAVISSMQYRQKNKEGKYVFNHIHADI